MPFACWFMPFLPDHLGWAQSASALAHFAGTCPSHSMCRFSGRLVDKMVSEWRNSRNGRESTAPRVVLVALAIAPEIIALNHTNHISFCTILIHFRCGCLPRQPARGRKILTDAANRRHIMVEKWQLVIWFAFIKLAAPPTTDALFLIHSFDGNIWRLTRGGTHRMECSSFLSFL